ncbi:MAG: hypothetical protein AAGA99_00195 [Actinomycetota bacterium]
MAGSDVLHAGAASSIGSLPHTDPVEAARITLAACPQLPAGPELVRRDERSSLLGSVAAAVPGVALVDGALAAEDPIDPDGPLDTAIDPERDAGLIALLEQVDERCPAVKVQVPGPVTVATALVHGGVPIARAVDVATRFSIERGRAMVEAVADAAATAVPVLVLDEPGLVTLTDDRAVMTVNEAIDLDAQALAAVESVAVTGLHCCGPTDWGAVFQTGAEIVFAPVGSGLEGLPGAAGAHLERGGWIGWGVVPTHSPIGTSGERLWKHLAEVWCSMVRSGCDPLLLRTQAIITPECGMAGHGESQAERVLEITSAVAERAHDQVVAVRFAVGA